MSRDRELIQQKINRIQQDIMQIKSTQLASGDSWVLYSISGSFTRAAQQKVKLVFTPTTEGPFFFNIYEASGTAGSLAKFFHDYENQGVCYYTSYYGSGTVNYVIQSTKRGTVEVSYL